MNASRAGVLPATLFFLLGLTACDIPTRPTSVENLQPGSDQSQLFAGQLAHLGALAGRKQISDDEFVQQLSELLTRIDSAPDGVQLLQRYLEANVIGRRISFSSTTPAPALPIELFAESNQSLWEKIKNSTAYKMLQAFLETVIFAFVPDPAGTLINLSDPDFHIGLSRTIVEAHLKEALYNPSAAQPRITLEQYTECHNLVGTNPYAAERCLLTAQRRPIPAYLQRAPQSCQVNCEAESGSYFGSFVDRGRFTRPFGDTTCVWDILFRGSVSLDLTVRSNNATGGSVRVSGNWSSSRVSGGNSRFRCVDEVANFDETGSVSGFTTRMNWATDLTTAFRGTFTGELRPSLVIGTIAVSYRVTGGTGSANLVINLRKQ